MIRMRFTCRMLQRPLIVSSSNWWVVVFRPPCPVHSVSSCPTSSSPWSSEKMIATSWWSQWIRGDERVGYPTSRPRMALPCSLPLKLHHWLHCGQPANFHVLREASWCLLLLYETHVGPGAKEEREPLWNHHELKLVSGGWNLNQVILRCSTKGKVKPNDILRPCKGANWPHIFTVDCGFKHSSLPLRPLIVCDNSFSASKTSIGPNQIRCRWDSSKYFQLILIGNKSSFEKCHSGKITIHQNQNLIGMHPKNILISWLYVDLTVP